MKQRQYEDFVGFRFGAVHSSELGIKCVTTSNRYEKELLPTPTDTTTDIAGSDGQYYFGSVYKNREFVIDIAFDDIDEELWRKMAQFLATDKLQDLVFDELPFKTYKAKLKSKPDLKYICFYDKEREKRIYKGEGKLTFVCYYPYAFCFNKYLTRAADYYFTPHTTKMIDDVNQSPYEKEKKLKQRPFLTTEHYNVKGNINPWKGGYPDFQQVQSGELYFDAPDKGKTLIDTRAYWKNTNEWQPAAQLLVSPTLDQDGELIYLPQYSKINYYNMDTGLNNENGLIGSRLLVYNPGDLPIDFELKLGNLSSLLRQNLDNYTFRISRYNVQRLSIEQAVDWTGLTTYNSEDNDLYKYGNKYFKIIETSKNNEGDSCNYNRDDWDFQPYLRELGCAHPRHTYIVEPIPREKLGYFIRLYYWQSYDWNDSGQITYLGQHSEKFEQGIMLADRYEELYQNCITDEERYELYWKTLSDLLSNDISLYDYIYNPPEFFKTDNLNYGEFEFNNRHYPSYYTFDYFDISNEGFTDILGGRIEDNSTIREYTLPLFFDSERRMLYNINRNNDKYNFKLTKNIFNDNIKKGHWFKLPPGWSLIDIAPVINDDAWGGKRWLDARPFDWGKTDINYRNWYNEVYYVAAIDYLSENITDQGILVGNSETELALDISATPKEKKNFFKTLTLDQLENYMQFARWYNYDTINIYETNTLEKEINRNNASRAEIGFLKLLANYWRVNKVCNGRAQGDINDWWWYANNYIWENFPPLYWGYADLLNKAEIKYIPLYY